MSEKIKERIGHLQSLWYNAYIKFKTRVLQKKFGMRSQHKERNMHVQKITDNIYWVGGNDRRLERFENMFPIPDGVCYNSYLILDEKTCLMDTVDTAISRLFIENITHVLNGRDLDYLVINHMEPDHCANIEELVRRYPNIKIV